MSNGYVVIMQHNFDAETRVVYFQERDKAVAYLHWAWEDYYNTEIAECPDSVIEEDTYHEENYALISYKEGGITEFLLSEVDDPLKGFETVNWRRYL